MERKLFDVYGVMGLLISVIIALFTIYSPSKEVAFEYISIGVIGILLIGIAVALLNRFAIINNRINNVNIQLKETKNDLDKMRHEFNLIDKRFKTLEDLNDIRLDIKDLKRKIFKK